MRWSPSTPDRDTKGEKAKDSHQPAYDTMSWAPEEAARAARSRTTRAARSPPLPPPPGHLWHRPHSLTPSAARGPMPLIDPKFPSWTWPTRQPAMQTTQGQAYKRSMPGPPWMSRALRQARLGLVRVGCVPPNGVAVPPHGGRSHTLSVKRSRTATQFDDGAARPTPTVAA